MNPVNSQKFKIGDRVKLNRSINGKNNSFKHSEGSIGYIVQIYHASAIRVKFLDNTTPIIASIYLNRAE